MFGAFLVFVPLLPVFYMAGWCFRRAAIQMWMDWR